MIRRSLGILLALSLLIIVAGIYRSPRRDFEALRIEGMNLTPDAVKSFEARLMANPDDFEVRYQLAWYYSVHSYGPDGSRLPQAREHALWIIRNRPDAYLSGQFMTLWDDLDGLAAIRQIWLENVQRHGENPAVLGNAADFLQLWTRDPGQAYALLLKAQRLDPTNPEWSRALGYMYGNKCQPPHSEGLSSDARAEFAARAVAAFEQALRYSDRTPPNDEMLLHVIRNALRAGQLDKADRYARELADSSIEDAVSKQAGLANAACFGNLVIAHVALEKQDLARAEQYLLRLPAAAYHRRQLVMPGPMNLAEGLLRRGRPAAVIEYLRRCKAVQRACGPQEVVPIPDPLLATIDQWISEIESGRTPKFYTGRWY